MEHSDPDQKREREGEKMVVVPGASSRRDTGGGQSHTQGGQTEVLRVDPAKPLLNFQYRAGPHTTKADTTAKITRHFMQSPERRAIAA